MTDIAALGFAVDSAPLQKGSAELDKLSAAAKRAEDAATGMATKVNEAAKKAVSQAGGAGDALSKLADGVRNLWNQLTDLQNVVRNAVAALAVGAVVNLVDAYSDLNARVGLAVRNMEASGVVMDRLATVARRTYSSLELTAESFIRNANTLRDLGKSTNEMLDYTEALNLALVVSGAKGDRARMVQESLSRAMAGGALRGQELNTVIESGGRVAEVLAEELGVSVNQLRAMGEQGKITGDVMFNALVKRLQSLQEEAEKMPATIGDALLIVRNSLLQLIGVYDQQNKLSETLATSIISLADSLGVLAKAAGVAAAGLAVAFHASILAGAAQLVTLIGVGLVAAFRALTVAMLANPLTALATLLAIVVSSFFLFRDELFKADGALRPLGEAIEWVVEKLYLLHDVFRAVITEITKEGVNDDAFKALAAQRLELERTLEMLTEARDAATGKGADTSAFDASIASVKSDIQSVMEEYKRLNDIREQGELSFTERVAREVQKRRDLRAWEQGTTVQQEDPFGLDKQGTKAPDLPDTKAYDKRTESVRRQVEAMKIEAETYGMTEAAAARYRVQKELENEAAKAGIELSTMRRAEILAEADAFAQATARVEGLRMIESLQTTEEAEAEHYQRRLQMLQEFQASGTVSVQQTAELWSRIQQEHLIQTQSAYAQTAGRIASTLDSITSAIGTEGKKQFEISKALSIASAVLKGYESAVSSYAAGSKIGGPPLGAVFAALSIASTAAMIAQIKSTSYSSSSASGARPGSGSGGASAPVTSSPTAPTQQQAAPQIVHLTLQGSKYTREDVRELVESINDAQRDGIRINVVAA